MIGKGKEVKRIKELKERGGVKMVDKEKKQIE